MGFLSLPKACRIILITVLAVLGILLTVAGIFMHFYLPKVIEAKIVQKLVISEDSPTFQNWKRTPIPVSLQVYLFNVTNPEAVMAGKKPILTQMGPYAFLQYREKVDIEFDDFTDQVTFTPIKTYHYDPDNTVGDIYSDNITMLNIPLVKIAQTAKGMSSVKVFLLNAMITGQKAKPFITKTVNEVLFDGYYDSLIAQLSKLKKEQILKNNSFGLFYGQNGTADSVYTVYTGKSDITKISSVVTYNNMSSLPYWNSSYCNMINGTDGSSFAPFVHKQPLEMFTTDLCRSFSVSYVRDIDHHGIRLFRYQPQDSLLESAAINPDNECYCLRPNDCPGSGVLNISVCKKGAPLVLSLPHFYMGAEQYVSGVDGLNPNKEEHETIIDVEPYTGVVMNAKKRIQINVDLQRVPNVVGFKTMRDVTLPIVWVNESASLDEMRAGKFKEAVYSPMHLAKIMPYALAGIGLLILFGVLICVIVTVRNMGKSKSSKDLPSKGLKIEMTDTQKDGAGEKLLSQPNGHPTTKENNYHVS